MSQGIAGEDDFEKQAELAAGVVMWYQQYVRILRRLSGRTPVAVSGFCGAGGGASVRRNDQEAGTFRGWGAACGGVRCLPKGKRLLRGVAPEDSA